ncbi:SusC/RagA family TonB-linked outer membrane protein [Sphingobacterium alkalisoli]|uniref:SusC/RagA family TonB-linked outer membrane protein n=1 Tax=Sphingobacterium alkalisoli TaxID=1874115 RepID=A0A4U0GY28_9SPHI|nr:SusC/RagA family TonB-linked outer membrane protein [Sphingobacterium alkalisoli]TJY62762.1 SusC/RagA family TonB-linked outer membrane protein [Sphingobacterium alkalisoli]GGH28724.1 SusC/RagA family TonB-linked outer membrane protein [Sphingobacterium alkalisoli]
MKSKLLMLFIFLLVYSGGYAQRKVSLEQALNDVTRIYGTKFSYEEGLLRDAQVNADLVPKNKNTPVESVLKELLYPSSFLFLYVQNNYYTIIRDSRGSKDNDGDDRYWKVITGHVKDSDGNPLVGVSVMPDGVGARNGVSTSSDGRYTLRLTQPAEALTFSFVGMQPQRRVIGTNTQIDVSMGKAENLIEDVEVVSMGYTQIPKERAPGSFVTISSKQIKETPTINIMERIQGLVPGMHVDIKTNSIRIRGVNSFGLGVSKDPLIVIDGFPMAEVEDNRFGFTERSSLQGGGGAILSQLNPDDIESITVLKDAAASSIWGAKAANGVIVIETKKGRNAPTAVNFSSTFSVSSPANLNKLDRMSTAEYIELERELFNKEMLNDNVTYWGDFNTNSPLTESLEWMFKVKRGTATEMERDAALGKLAGIDNRSQIRDYLLQNATSQQYNMSFSGGSNKSTFFLSGNYSKDVPVFRANMGETLTLTSNLTNMLFNDRVKVETGVNYNYGNSLTNTAAINAMSSNPQMGGLLPYDLLKDENGDNIRKYLRYRPEVMEEFESLGYLDWAYSPMEELETSNYNDQSHNIRMHLDINTKLTSWANFSVMGQLQRKLENTENIDYVNSYSMRNNINYGTTVNSAGNLVYNYPMGGNLGTRNYNGSQYLVRTQLSINKTFGQRDIYALAFIGGAEIKQNDYRSSSGNFIGFDPLTYVHSVFTPNGRYDTVDGWGTTFSSNGTIAKNKIRALSYYSNSSLSAFNNKYVISGSLRFDDFTVVGASREQRAKPLWSIGGKWDAKKEDFLKDAAWADALGLRMTYGVNGTLPTGIGSVVVITTSSDNTTGEGVATISFPANNQISWEKVKTFNIGLDYGFWNNSLQFNVDYYTKRTSDILYSLPFNPTYGWTSVRFNSATMEGQGVDFGLRANWFRSTSFRWNTMFNFGYNVNEVTDSRFEKPTNVSQLLSGSVPIVDLPTDYIYAYNWAGLDGEGRSQIYKADGSIVTANQGINELTVEDLQEMGRTTPPYVGGLFNTFGYKDFSLGIRVTYEIGHVLRRLSVQNYPQWNYYSGAIGLQSDLADRWQNAGDEANTDIPAIVNDGWQFNSVTRYSNSDKLVISGSHIRLQQIDFGYRIPQNLISKTPFKSIGLNGAVRNLGIIWRKNKEGVDPSYRVTDSYSSLPPAPSFFFSLNASF